MRTILFIILICFTTSCVAQKKIANLKDNTIEKALTNKYSIKREANGVSLINTSNKFTSVKQISPNMAPNETNLLAPLDRKTAVAQLTKICANIIAINQLEELTKIKNSNLFIRIKTNIKGNPIELEFYIKANPILTLNQLESIEKEILQHFTIKLATYTVNVVKGSNFLTFDYSIYFADMLKVKKGL